MNKKNRVIKQGKLFRSSHLADLNDTEVEQLSGLGIAEVFDLRRGSERKAFPNRLTKNMHTHEFEIDVGSTKHFFERLAQGGASRETTHEMMRHSYTRYVTDMRDQFARMMTLLAQAEEGGVLLHCMVGKDRTGISIAIVLLALGIPRATIMEDYLLSNKYYPEEKLRALLMRYLKQAGVGDLPEDVMKPFCSVHKDYLQSAFDAIDNGHGGTQSYLTESLGLSDPQLRTISEKFLRH